MSETTEYISAITLDEHSIANRSDHLANERHVAMNDIVEWNHFTVAGAKGPYALALAGKGNKIQFTVTPHEADKPLIFMVTLAALRGLVKDYFLICESYFEALKVGNLPRIEAIDMSRRALHNEGAELLTEFLAGKVTMDSETARRLFTLICVLHLK